MNTPPSEGYAVPCRVQPAHSQDRKHERRGSIPPETASVPTLAPAKTCEAGFSPAVSELTLGWNAAPASDRNAGLSLLKVACLSLGLIPAYPALPRNGSLG